MGELTDEDSPLTLSLGQFKTFTEHLNELTAQDSSLAKSLAHLEDLSNQLTKNDNITVTLANFRASSEELKVALDRLGPDLEATLSNAKDFTGTLRTQPWRLIWPTTKKYPKRGDPDPGAQSDEGKIAPNQPLKRCILSSAHVEVGEARALPRTAARAAIHSSDTMTH